MLDCWSLLSRYTNPGSTLDIIVTQIFPCYSLVSFHPEVTCLIYSIILPASRHSTSETIRSERRNKRKSSSWSDLVGKTRSTSSAEDPTECTSSRIRKPFDELNEEEIKIEGMKISMGYVGKQGQSIDVHQRSRRPMFTDSSNDRWGDKSMGDERYTGETVDHFIGWVDRWCSTWGSILSGHLQLFGCHQDTFDPSADWSQECTARSSIVEWKYYHPSFDRELPRCVSDQWTVDRWKELHPDFRSSIGFSRWISRIGIPIIYQSMMTDVYSSLTTATREFICWVLNWRILRFSWSRININSVDRRDFVTYERSNSWSLVRQDWQENQVVFLCSMFVDNNIRWTSNTNKNRTMNNNHVTHIGRYLVYTRVP